MKKHFYPNIKNKTDLFEQGYISKRSSHSRGSTVDVTIIDTRKDNVIMLNNYCDNSIDMGSCFDFFGKESNYSNSLIVNNEHIKNRKMLRETMSKEGFEPYDKEWWHFTYKQEIYKNTYFDFDIE